MAGEAFVFTESKIKIWEGSFNPAAHTFKLAICDNTTTPIPSQTTPNISDFTQVGTAGTYVSGGVTLAGVTLLASGTSVILDSTTNPLWDLHESNDIDAFWGILYETTLGLALGFIDLGGPVSMRSAPLSITWSSYGIFIFN